VAFEIEGWIDAGGRRSILEAIPGLWILPDGKDANAVIKPTCYFYEH